MLCYVSVIYYHANTRYTIKRLVFYYFRIKISFLKNLNLIIIFLTDYIHDVLSTKNYNKSMLMSRLHIRNKLIILLNILKKKKIKTNRQIGNPGRKM